MKETLKTTAEQTKEIDRKKRILEAKARIRFQKIFNNIADDVSSLLLSSQTINTEQVAQNYNPDFIGSLRETYREVAKTFGFSLRKDAEKKYNIDFQLSTEKKKIDNLKKKQEFEITQQQEQEVNRSFLQEVTLFINNRSELQADKITQTNAKEIQSNIDKSIGQYNALLANNLAEQQEINSRITEISVGVLLGTVAERDKRKLENQLSRLTDQQENLKKNRNPIVSRNFSKNFKKRGKTRSETISEFEVGQTESFIRQTEAESLDNIVLKETALTVKKNWDATLDSRTRDAHIQADATYHFNPIPVFQSFIVGGERLKYPRDPNGSPSNIINCRCVSHYSLRD